MRIEALDTPSLLFDRAVMKRNIDAMPNVLMLPHLGYLTDQALIDMVENSLRAAKAWMDETPDQDTEAAKETHEN